MCHAKVAVISGPQAEALALIILKKIPVTCGGRNGVAVSFILLYLLDGGNLDFAVAGGKGRKGGDEMRLVPSSGNNFCMPTH